ncbi:MAG: glutamine-hydrolyzing carbamoyl-phosphate synthase small subunit [Thermoanaerobaculum sp.]
MTRTTAAFPGARRGYLALADGRAFSGWVLGPVPALGEVVFNTAMFGYQEMLTDPSYRGQILVLTTPHVGVVGTNPEDRESPRVWASGLVVQELEPVPSNWRSQKDLLQCTEENRTPLGFGFDTRAIVVHLRRYGALPGALVATEDREEAVWLARQAKPTDGQDLTGDVSRKAPEVWREGPWKRALPVPAVRVGVLDFGVKASILRQLVAAGAEVLVLPGNTGADDVAAFDLDGLVVSNGPGDPAAVGSAVRLLERLLGRLPILGVCLGHQLLALALGGRTYKLKFGHHGANHPVQVLGTGEVWITSQNHNYAVDAETLPKGAEVSMTNLTDGSVEGIVASSLKAEGIQFHPEAGPGPHDALRVFADFVARCQIAKGDR